MNTMIMDSWQDLRYGARMLMRRPGFALAAILTLALGIGANTAIFSVVNSVLLRPLPYPRADRLVMVWENNPELQLGVDNLPLSSGAFAAWRDQSEVFDAASVLTPTAFNLSDVETPEQLNGMRVSADFFQVMGLAPARGRAFAPEDDEPGRNGVVVISHALWQERFGGDPEILGKMLTLNGEAYVVIGVMAGGFEFPAAGDLPAYMGVPPKTQVWTPIALTNEELGNFGSHPHMAIARLAAGVSLAQAQSELRAIYRRLEERYEDSRGWTATLVPLQTQVVGGVRVALLVILAAVAFVLLIACANVANLLLARVLARRREMSLRGALGASRWRLVRQVLAESFLLSAGGGALGLLAAVGGVKALVAVGPTTLPRLAEIGVDGSVLGFTLVASLGTALIFGITPAWLMSRTDPCGVLEEDSARATASWRRNPMRNMLIVGQVAVSLVLLVGAGLLLESFAHLTRAHPGFTTGSVLTLRVARPYDQGFGGTGEHAAFFREVLERVAAVPGVRAVGAVSHLPLSGAEQIDDFIVEGMPARTSSDAPLADLRSISPDYFRAMGIRLLQGRVFTEQDRQDARRVAIVSESLARRFWPGEDPLGKRVNRGDPDRETDWLTVVGVVEDVKHSALEMPSRPHIYQSYLQLPWSSMTLVIRADGAPASVADAVRAEVWAVDPDQPVTAVRPMDDYLSEMTAPRRFNLQLVALSALLALLLSAVGLYGVLAYSVAIRTREIGIRAALGAPGHGVLKFIILQGMKLVLVGVVIGLGGALALTRWMQTLLYGVSATDPFMFTVTSLLLAGVALVACYLPARRATRVDPMIALRTE